MPIVSRVGALVLLGLAALAACAPAAPNSPSATALPATSPVATATHAADPNRTELATMQAALNATDLRVSVRDEPDPVAPGAELRYVITVTNAGPNPATATQVDVTLPDAARYLRVDPDTPGCRAAGTALTCELGEIIAREARALTVVVAPTAPGVATLRAAALNRAGPDTNPGDNAFTEHTTVAAP